MRIISLLPSATEIICALGLRDQLVGITHECDFPLGIEKEKPILVENCLGAESKDWPPEKIDAAVREKLLSGEGVYRFKPGLLESLKPDLIITQGLCDVCAIPYPTVQEIARKLKPAPEVLSLDPTDVTGVLADVRRVGEATGKVAQAGELVEQLEERVGAVAGAYSGRGDKDRPKVVCLEWTEPVFVGGHWIPEMVELAGGRDVLGKIGEPSRTVEWQQVLDAQPDVIALIPCGYDEAKSRAEIKRLEQKPGWKELPAVKKNRVHAFDANAFYSRPGPRIVDGLEQFARMINP